MLQAGGWGGGDPQFDPQQQQQQQQYQYQQQQQQYQVLSWVNCPLRLYYVHVSQ